MPGFNSYLDPKVPEYWTLSQRARLTFYRDAFQQIKEKSDHIYAEFQHISEATPADLSIKYLENLSDKIESLARSLLDLDLPVRELFQLKLEIERFLTDAMQPIQPLRKDEGGDV